MATLIKADGIKTEIQPKNGTDFNLKRLRLIIAFLLMRTKLVFCPHMDVNNHLSCQHCELKKDFPEPEGKIMFVDLARK